MRVVLVPPSIWQPELANVTDAGNQAPSEHVRLVAAVLWTLQDAHIGITPRLAAQAASLLTRSRSADAGIWARIANTLRDAVSESRVVGFNASANPGYFLLKIIRPLVWQASALCGASYLLCRDPVPSELTAREYSEHERTLERMLEQVMLSERRNTLFCREQGAVVSTFSGPTAARRNQIPEMDRVVPAILFGLPDEIPDDRWDHRPPPSPSFISRRRPSAGARESRIEGVRHSRREADLDQIVPTELLASAEERIDRIVNTGFLIYDRRPRRERLRDVLVAGVMPHSLVATGGGAFAKACWADALVRLSRRLVGSRLLRTEFRWIEGDALGRVRDCSFFLDRLRPDAVSEPSHDVFRREFLSALGWLPDFVEGQHGFEAAKARPATGGPPRASAEGTAEADGDRDGIRGWLSAAWRTQTDRPDWRRAAEGAGADWESERGLSLADRFSFVHVIAFVPATMSRDARAAARLPGRLRADLGLGSHPRRSASVAFVPKAADIDAWGVGLPTEPYRRLGAKTQFVPATLAAHLEGAWLQSITRQLWHG